MSLVPTLMGGGGDSPEVHITSPGSPRRAPASSSSSRQETQSRGQNQGTTILRRRNLMPEASEADEDSGTGVYLGAVDDEHTPRSSMDPHHERDPLMSPRSARAIPPATIKMNAIVIAKRMFGCTSTCYHSFVHWTGLTFLYLNLSVWVLAMLVAPELEAAYRWVNLALDVYFGIDAVVEAVRRHRACTTALSSEDLWLFLGSLPWELGFLLVDSSHSSGVKHLLQITNICRLRRMTGQRRYANPFRPDEIWKVRHVLLCTVLMAIGFSGIVVTYLAFDPSEKCSWMVQAHLVDASFSERLKWSVYRALAFLIGGEDGNEAYPFSENRRDEEGKCIIHPHDDWQQGLWVNLASAYKIFLLKAAVAQYLLFLFYRHVLSNNVALSIAQILSEMRDTATPVSSTTGTSSGRDTAA